MKKIFRTLTLGLAALASVSFAQQDPQFTQFMHSKLIYNPGYAGTSEAICTNVLYRQQWVNFPGAPRTGLISFDMPIGQLPIAIGLNVMNDQIGFDKTLFARLALAYNRHIGAGVLGVGIDGGILQKQFNGNWIAPDGNTVADASIPAYTGGTVTTSGLNKLSYDVGFGAFYSIANKMYVGISSTHLAAQDIKSSGNVKFALARHYYIVGGYTFNFGEGGMHGINPNVKIKSDAASTQVDINVTYIYNQKIWAGISYRMQDAIAPMLGYKWKGAKIGYSYDLTTSKIKGYSAGTHEIMLGYCFNVKKPKKVSSYQNARFLD
ncbi:MAG: type IX secretion system membrane protein PorP/SprF [Bacteroidia bacterium]|jgi:type IX secretion system PorP/SprF family membrane protein|nr:type IX secretion system membrane protein PorP/SprF [Bacteroidia bacterium]